MWRKLFLILFILFFTGCDVVYNIEIKDGIVKESTNFNIEESDNIVTNPSLDGANEPEKSFDEFVENYYNEDYFAFYNKFSDDKLYTKKYLNDGSGLNLSYSYNLSNYSDSSLLHSCFDKISVKDDVKALTLNYEGSNGCFTQDSYGRFKDLTVNIKPDGKVIKSNADKVSKGIYTWKLSKKDEGKDIFISIKYGTNNYFIIFLVLSLILLSALGIYFYFIKKNNNTTL